MDKYKELISLFSDVLEKSKDYHIAYIYQVGYVSLVGLLSKEEGQNLSMIVMKYFPRRKGWRKVYCVTGAGSGFMKIGNCCHEKIMMIFADSMTSCRIVCGINISRIFYAGRTKYRLSYKKKVRSVCILGVR